jgi:hypothetical protein
LCCKNFSYDVIDPGKPVDFSGESPGKVLNAAPRVNTPSASMALDPRLFICPEAAVISLKKPLLPSPQPAPRLRDGIGGTPLADLGNFRN